MKRSSGFSLIEIMVAVAIVGILAMIAYPSFMQSVRRGNRADAHTAIMDTANRLERFFATNGSYTTDPVQLGLPVVAGVAFSGNGHYTITITPGPSGTIATSYAIVAAPVAGDIQAGDQDCPQFSMDSLGARLPDPAQSRCW